MLNASLHPTPTARGFTLLELMMALAVAALLAAVALPSFSETLRKGRRTDAITRLAQLQQSEERWRSNNRSYGTLGNLQLPSDTAEGLYQIKVLSSDEAGYVALATAQGAQAADGPCRHLRVAVNGADTTLASGPDLRVANDAAQNRRCWNR